MILPFILTLALNTVPEPPPFPPGDDGNEPEHEASGQELYEKECAVCHGAKGEGTGRGYPLQRIYRPYATEIVRDGRRGHREFPIPMPAYSAVQVSDKQLAEIWNFLESRSLGTDGRSLFEAYCANCHGKDAQGGMVGHKLDGSGKNIALWIRWGAGDGDYAQRKRYMPAWNQWEISDAEIQLITSYLKELSLPKN